MATAELGFFYCNISTVGIHHEKSKLTQNYSALYRNVRALISTKDYGYLFVKRNG